MTKALIASLRSTAGNMTPALAKVAHFVLAHPDTTLYQSITELAESSGSSEASVMRFCRDQGFSGFQDFKLALAKELANDERGKDSAEPADDIQRLVETAVIALRETEQLIVREHVTKAAKELLAAQAVECFGVAASAVTAAVSRLQDVTDRQAVARAWRCAPRHDGGRHRRQRIGACDHLQFGLDSQFRQDRRTGKIARGLCYRDQQSIQESARRRMRSDLDRILARNAPDWRRFPLQDQPASHR